MMMLAFDTCFGACSAAVSWRDPVGDVRVLYRFERMDRGHAERLIPMIGELVEQAPFGWDTLDAIVVTNGPGTFTGARVGIAAARALALASGASVLTLSSLELVARTASHALPHDLALDLSLRDLVVAVDARRDQLYVQTFDGKDVAPLSEPLLVTPADAVRRLGRRDTVAVGSGAMLLAEAARRCGRMVAVVRENFQPDARFALDERFVDRLRARAPHGAARPLYLRPPDAKPQDGNPLARVL